MLQYRSHSRLNDKKANKYLQKATVLSCCFLFLMISLCSNAVSRRAFAVREKQLITVFRDAPEQNKKLKITTLVSDAYRLRYIASFGVYAPPNSKLCLRAVGEPLGKIKVAAGALPAAKAFCLPLTSEFGLTAVRSRSRENNTQLFSNTLAPLRYALCAECRTQFCAERKRWVLVLATKT